jgi:hypothetical protein
MYIFAARDTKAYRGKQRYSSTFSPSAPTEARGRVHAPAVLTTVNHPYPPVPNGQEAGWAPEQVRTFWAKEIYRHCRVSNSGS